jgi:hypothetical protein
MTQELATIKTAYEQENMTPEEIAEDRSLDLAAVKAGLMQCSAMYRKACGKEEVEEDTLNFSRDEQQRVKDALLGIGLGADDDNLRFKALVYIRDDSKGRKDVVKQLGGQNFNILMINEKMKQIRDVTERIKNGGQKLVNV